MIIGLTGRNGSGKGEVAKYLKERGFEVYSLSDVIREEAARRGLDSSRENLIQVGNDLREKQGPGVLAQKVVERFQPYRNYAVDSIRNPAEIEVLRTRQGFLLIFLDAPENLRFERVCKRGRPGDPQTIEEFRKSEEKELSNTSESSQQLLRCQELADEVAMNDGSVEELHKKVATILGENLRFDRPGWDEYFMRIAAVVATRSNCVKRKVAAIIVKDRRVISTGYNGTPRGTRNCNEGGCPRCNSFVPSGTRLEECLCSHGEENAIVQAAYHGIRLGDSSLYTTFAPCLMCTKMIINAGIKEVVYNADYPLNQTSLELLEEAGIMLRQHQVH